jgi:hypothetical protein
MDEEIKRADLYMDSNGDMIFIDEDGQEYLLTPIREEQELAKLEESLREKEAFSSYIDIISSRTLH